MGCKMMIDKTFGCKVDGISYYDRVGAYLIAIDHNLLATVKTPKGYFLPGGGVDGSESRVDCIHRECLEEIGCSVTIKQYICSAEDYMIHEKFAYFHPVQYYYSGNINFRITPPIEVDHKLEWIPINQAAIHLYVEMQRWAVDQYVERENRRPDRDI